MTDFQAMAIMLKEGKLMVNTNLIECKTNRKREAFKITFEVDAETGEKIMGNCSKRMMGLEIKHLPMLVLVDIEKVEEIKNRKP